MIKLPPVRMDRRARFEEYCALNGAFDYYGMERGGHFAILEWVLTMGGKPFMHVGNTKTACPSVNFYHPSGWHSMEKPPRLMALGYGPDPDITTPFSRIDSRKVVVCVRDIRNCVASRLKYHDTNKGAPFRIDSLMAHAWKSYAKQALGDEDYFQGRCVAVQFDTWVQSIEYRSQLWSQMCDMFGWELDFEAGETQTTRVPVMGGGSSFDNREFDGKASKMKVLSRWKAYKKDERFTRLLTDEVLELNQRLIKE